MILTCASDKDSERRRDPANSSATTSSGAKVKSRKKRSEGSEVGSALRSAYQRTIDEAIPSEMLDLLGKLG